MEQLVRIRMAEPRDAEKILKIYAPYIRETAVTFEYEVPRKGNLPKGSGTSPGICLI